MNNTNKPVAYATFNSEKNLYVISSRGMFYYNMACSILIFAVIGLIQIILTIESEMHENEHYPQKLFHILLSVGVGLFIVACGFFIVHRVTDFIYNAGNSYYNNQIWVPVISIIIVYGICVLIAGAKNTIGFTDLYVFAIINSTSNFLIYKIYEHRAMDRTFLSNIAW
jgi:hypothetical protein